MLKYTLEDENSKEAKSTNINVLLNSQVLKLIKPNNDNDKTKLVYQSKNNDDNKETYDEYSSDEYDYVINCTYYTNFLSNKVILKNNIFHYSDNVDHYLNVNVLYEPCISLLYKPPKLWQNNDQNLWSFTIMDGRFPCIMPYCSETTDGTIIDTK